MKLLLNSKKKIIFDCNAITSFCQASLIDEFKYIPLDQKEFNKINYYRLTKIKVKCKFENVRQLFKEQRDQIKNNSFPSENPYGLTNKIIYTHILDQSIAICCSNFKSIMTNYMNGTIWKFRFRKMKETKNNKIMRFEQSMLKHGTILNNIFSQLGVKCNGQLCKEFDILENPPKTKTGNIKCKCKNIITDLTFLEENKSDILIHHDKKNNKYRLLIPKKLQPIKKENINKIISIDPGVRTFLSCLSENKVVEVCEMADEVEVLKSGKIKIVKYNKLGRFLLKLNKITKIPNVKIRLKKQRQYEKLIKHHVDDLHWKTINYLTSNYDTIIIGNMCTPKARDINNYFIILCVLCTHNIIK